jgi:Spy/CpxP family protein refolding chaperone
MALSKTVSGKVLKLTGAAGVLAGGFLLLTGFGPGQGGLGHGWRSPEKIDKFVTFRLNDMLDDIKATPQQRAAVLASKDKVLSSFLQNAESRKETHHQIVEQWKSSNPDAKAIHAAIDAQIEKTRALAHQAADEALAVHAILTPEQREQIAGRMAGGKMFEP